MLRKLISILCLIFPVLTQAGMNSNDNDPFINRWLFNNGQTTYAINVTKADSSGNYHVNYTSPEGNMDNDDCRAQSGTTIYCEAYQYSESLTRDDANYTMTLNSNNMHGAYTYHLSGHEPPPPSIVGTWQNKCGENYYTTLKISLVSDGAYHIDTYYGAVSTGLDPASVGWDDQYIESTDADGSKNYTYTENFVGDITVYRMHFDTKKDELSPAGYEYYDSEDPSDPNVIKDSRVYGTTGYSEDRNEHYCEPFKRVS